MIPMRSMLSLTTPLVALVLVAAGSPAAAADACKNVVFKFTNHHKEGRDIRVQKVRFTNPHNGGKEQTENVKNTDCKPGATCSTAGDNLSNAAKVDLHAIKLVFRYKELDGDWSDEFTTQPFAPKLPKCTNDSQYGVIDVLG
jgi:hypothetical protein